MPTHLGISLSAAPFYTWSTTASAGPQNLEEHQSSLSPPLGPQPLNPTLRQSPAGPPHLGDRQADEAHERGQVLLQHVLHGAPVERRHAVL